MSHLPEQKSAPVCPPGLLLRSILILMVWFSLALLASAAPYHGDTFTYSQPDGEQIQVRLYGDEFFAYAETLDGYLVSRDPKTSELCYAKIVANGSKMISTGVRVDTEAPPPGLQPKERLKPETRAAKAEARREALGVSKSGQVKPELRAKLFPKKNASKDKGKDKKKDSPTAESGTDAPGATSSGIEATGGSFQYAPGGETVYRTALSSENMILSMAPGDAPSIQKHVGLVLLASFPDRPQDITKTQAEIDAFCNDLDYTGDGNATSVRGYFHIQSNGRVDYRNVVTAWFVAKNNRDYYANNTLEASIRGEALIREGLDFLAANGFDFTQCDADGNGVIDGVNLLYAGARTSDWGFGLWPHKGNDAYSGFTAQGLSSAFQYQISDMPSSLPIGTFCHENGHMLFNFPDLYSYDDSAAQLRRYSLMSSYNNQHPGNIDPYLKISAGWAEVTDLDSTSSQICLMQEGRNLFYRYINPARSNEHFLFEVRHNEGYEGPWGGHGSSVNPTSGLVVYHVLGSGSNTYSSIFTSDNPNFDFSTPYKVMLVEANPSTATTPWYGKPDPGSDDAFHAGGINSLSDSSYPTLNFWTSNGRTLPSGVVVRDVSVIGSVMSFTVGSSAVTAPATMVVTSDGIAASTTEGVDADSQSIAIFNSGTDSFTYSVASSEPWLSVSPAGGTVGAGADFLTLSFSNAASSLAQGTYTADITISSADASNPSVVVPVTLGVDAAWTVPAITQQPVGGHIIGDGSYTLTADASGYPEPQYEWYLDGEILTGVYGSILNISNASAADAGSYTVVAYNTAGSTSSDPIMVTVNDHPYIAKVTPVTDYATLSMDNGLVLEASVSDDGYGGSSLTNLWTVESAPAGGSVTWDSTSSASTGATFSAPGDYQLRLTSSDGVSSRSVDYFVTAGATPGWFTDPDLIVHYDFSNTSGSTVTDAAGGDQDGTLVDGTSFADGKLVADGTGGHLEIPSDPAIDTAGPYAKRTVIFWAKPYDPTNDYQILYEEGDEAAGMFIMSTPTGSMVYRIYNQNGNSSVSNWGDLSPYMGSVWAPNQWNHVAVVLDADPNGTALQNGAFRIYLNGALLRANKGIRLDSHPGGIGLGGINGKVRNIGSNVLVEGVDDYDFQGEFRDFRLYSRALTPSEIAKTIELSNLAPHIDAGAPASGYAGLPGALDGTVVDDELPKPSTLTTTWSVVSGPGAGSFADPAAVDTAFTGDAAGSYVLRLSANDGQVTTFDQTTFEATVTSGPGFAVFQQEGQTLSESAGTVEVTVTRPFGGGIDGAVTVDYAAVDVFAINGSDYTLAPGTLSWTDQESGPKTITFTIHEDDLMEGEETFRIELSNPSGGLVLASPSTHEVTIETSDFPTAWFIWDAALDEPGDDLWTSATDNEYTWDFDGLNRSPFDVSDSRLQALTLAYPFPEVADRGNTGWDAFGSNGPANFEFVIDVDGDNGIIFETGGSVDGIRLDLINGSLRGMIAESSNVVVSHTLTADEKFDFIHVVLVADNAADLLQLYVNGALKDSQTWSAGNDWSNTDNAGLGGTTSSTPDDVSTGDFEGAMAVFRFYRSAFSAAQAQAAYLSFHPLSNEAPVFANDPVDGGSVVEAAPYSGSLTGSASDADGNPITYAKVSGPAWLTVDDNGSLSGTPGLADVGLNSFTVSAGDGISAPVEATLLIAVEPLVPTLSYEGNGATGGSVPIDPNSPYAHGATANVLGHGDLVRSNHSFDSWNTAADGSGLSYAVGDSFVITNDSTLYAQWAGDSYTATFEVEGGTATSPPTIDVTYLSTYGSLPGTTREGYSFVGWFTAPTGGAEVTVSTTVTATGNHTLYARWNSLPSVSIGSDQSVAIGPFILWTPETLNNTVAWFDAQDSGTLTVVDGKIAQWDDKSDNANHAAQATAAERPDFTASDPMVVNQPSIGNSAASGSIGLVTPTMAAKNVYVITYYKDGADSSFDGYSTLMSGGARYGEYRVMGNQNSSAFIGTSNFNNAGTFKNGATSSSLSVLPMPASVLKVKSSAVRSQSYRLGFNGDASTRDWQGAYSEWVFTDGTEDADTEAMIEGYLAHKWALAGNLASGHPYATKAPGTENVTVELTPALSDAEDDSLTVLWSLVSGPGPVVFGDATVAQTSVTFSALGEYVLRLTVNDGSGEIHDEVTITIDPSGDDVTPPTLTSSNIVDDQGGADVAPGTTVTYTITFSEDMDAATVDATDFSNAGTAPVTIGAVSEVTPGVFTVEVTPGDIGSLQLQVSAAAVLADPTGNLLDTTNAIADDTILQVITMLTVPDLVGLTQATAESEIVTEGFAVGTITTQADPAVPAGKIISQSPMAGASAVSGSSIDLVVSIGSELLISTNFGSGGVSGHLDWNDGGVFGISSWHVKNPNALNDYTRKGYVRFDTSSLGTALTSAALELTVSNIDSAIGGNDQSLYIYGITDESLDEVPLVDSLTWANGPANDPASPYLADTGKATLLGILLLDYNGDLAAPIGTTVAFSSQALLDFLNADTNQKVTFLIGRTGNNSEKNLMFAGDSSATYAAPGLRVTGASDGNSDGFDTWAAQSSGSVTFGDDQNNDGIAAGLAWLLGASHPDLPANAHLPTLSAVNGPLIVRFHMLAPTERGSASLQLQFSNDLGLSDPWVNHTITIPDSTSTVDEVIFVITPVEGGALHQVEATLPASAEAGTGRLFLRILGISE